MGGKIIKIMLGDWQYNAGLVGLYRILKHSGKDIQEYTRLYVENGNEECVDASYELCMPIEYLDGFTEAYYSYLIDTYMEQLGYGRIISFKRQALDIRDSDDASLTKEKVDILNSYIQNVLLKYMKSASFKAAFEIIDASLNSIGKTEGTCSASTHNEECVSKNLLDKVRNTKPVKLSESESVISKRTAITEACENIIEIIDVLERSEYRRHLGGKNVIYNYIKNNWDKISILNPLVKEKNIYVEFDNYFVKSCIEYVKSDKEKHRYRCFCCDMPIKDSNINLSFLAHTGFDAARKTSHVWDFQNDVAICELCRLVYACMPAGFIYGFDTGLFINSNSNINALLNVNTRLSEVFFADIKQGERGITYKSIVDAILKKKKEGLRYELADVQVAIYENGKYRFNLLHEELLKIVYKCEESFNNIRRGTLHENKRYLSIYDETIKRLLDNQNMFLWINKLLHYYVSDKEACRYSVSNIFQILLINTEYLKGVETVESIDKNKVHEVRKYGWHVRKEYSVKNTNAVKKIDSITYKMLNSLKTSNPYAFIDILVHCYMYIGKEIPKVLTECLTDKDTFKTFGYAFVIGLNGVDFVKEKNKEDK